MVHATHVSFTDDGSVARHIAAFLASYESDNTRRAYRLDLDDWTGWCRRHNVDPLASRRSDLDGYMAHLEARRLKPSTRSRRLRAIRSLFAYLITDGVLEVNPAVAVRSPKVVYEDQPYLNRVEVSQLLDVARDTAGYRHPLVLLLFFNGLRISEATAANVGDLGTERYHRTLKIMGKGAKPANVPLPPQVAAAVDQHLKERGWPGPDEPLLVSDRGSRLSRTTAAGQLKRLCRRAGVPEISPHGLRHTVITLLLLDGVPLRDVQLMARHADPSTTAKYDAQARTLDAHASYSVARALV